MAEIIKMPKLSDTMEEGVIASWHKKVGDKVNSGDVLAEIESDKATMEFESFHAGKLLHLEVEEGKSAPVDSLIAIIGEEGEDVKALIEEAKKDAANDAAKPAEKEEKPAEKAQAAKASAPAPTKAPTKKAAQPRPVEKPSKQEEDLGRLKISPLAKRLAEEQGISLRGIRGSGEGGRIVKRDIEKQGGNRLSAQIERSRDVEVTQMRKTIAKRLSESKFSAPHFYLTIDIDMDRAMDARKAINDAIAPDKVSFNDFVIKAAAVALKDHPAVNAGWHGDFIRYNEHVHVGVAVAVEDGLLVPVIRHADGKALSQISGEVRELAGKAKSKKLQPQEWEGNTFTISNLGMFGIEEFTAIINPPDSCIMAVGAIRQEAVVKDGELAVGNRMKVTLSCDHRVVDGATGAQFLNTFKKYMENPIVLLGMREI